jgi:predicted RNase H-like HicB family nuclease
MRVSESNRCLIPFVACSFSPFGTIAHLHRPGRVAVRRCPCNGRNRERRIRHRATQVGRSQRRSRHRPEAELTYESSCLANHTPLVLNEGMSADAPHQIELTAVLWAAPEGGFSALNPETGTVSEGETEAEALANLTEATELYLEEFPLSSRQKPVITTIRVADVA